MTFERIIKETKLKLRNTPHYHQFKTAHSISSLPDQRAYNLGLFFNKLRTEDFETYILLKEEVEYLRDHYDTKKLKGIFNLEAKDKRINTKITAWTLLIFIFGLSLVIIGIIRQTQGWYLVTIGSKRQPVYHTGLFYALIGLIICIANISSIRRKIKHKYFYKLYTEPLNISEKNNERVL